MHKGRNDIRALSGCEFHRTNTHILIKLQCHDAGTGIEQAAIRRFQIAEYQGLCLGEKLHCNVDCIHDKAVSYIVGLAGFTVERICFVLIITVELGDNTFISLSESGISIYRIVCPANGQRSFRRCGEYSEESA